ncbi:YdcH family protein [Pseudomonas sp. NPDC078416]|uniref:YdcH family protein n=1 Tax=Pseudomonas sp. NPDC078416 TaxID=3390637 RepID=UPI003D0571B5
MPVKHDLYADLSVTKEELAKLKSGDAKLNALVDHYDELDADIVSAEQAGDASDDELKKLKEKRLQAKDSIASHLNTAS